MGVIRPATPGALDRLGRAASRDDRELDAALANLGVLPPVDLDPIRACLNMTEIRLVAELNRDGHRLITVTGGDRVLAWIHHDGRVVMADHQLLSA